MQLLLKEIYVYLFLHFCQPPGTKSGWGIPMLSFMSLMLNHTIWGSLITSVCILLGHHLPLLVHYKNAHQYLFTRGTSGDIFVPAQTNIDVFCVLYLWI